MLNKFIARTETGLVRKANEDCCHADPVLGLFAVCDGMGGHRAGRIASELACDVLAESLRTGLEPGAPTRTLEELAREAVDEANQAILETAAGDSALLGMGTTCTLVLLRGSGRAVVAHVGDSRLYLADAEGVRQVTEDHSYVQELVNCGAITPADALVHPQRNVITRALGLNPQLNIDVETVPLKPGATLMLCSDGLSGCIFQTDLLAAPMTGESLRDGVDVLVQRALDHGGEDNISCIMVRPE